MPEKAHYRNLHIIHLATTALTPNPRNARTHPERQIESLKAGITEFGFTNPILIDENLLIIAGHGRHTAALGLGMKTVPCIQLLGLSAAQKTALAISDNKHSDMSSFDLERLGDQLRELTAVNYPLELTAFDTSKIDIILEQPTASKSDPADDISDLFDKAPPVTTQGDVWRLDKHLIICEDAAKPATFEALLGDLRADLVFADPPYNVQINGHVSGLGNTKHSEFVMASGEMSKAEFTTFLTVIMRNCARCSTNGSIHFHCMDWRHLSEILHAGAAAYSELKALCVWRKTNGGMGSLYRSQHELVLVFKSGTAPHVNNIQLGKFGRYRTNVWDYPGANTFRKGRQDDLADHPTVKPVALVADAIRDCSKRGALVLDPFLGSGTTILAAERTGRRAAGIEIDPHYVDTAIRRWQTLTGSAAVLVGEERSFEQVAALRQTAEAPNG